MNWLTSINWKWITLQVLLPIFGPIVISCIVVGFWVSLDTKFQPKWSPILDIGPWALVFYTVTLVLTSLQGLLPNAKEHVALTGAMILVALFVTIYAGCMELYRQQATAVVTARGAIPHSAYYVAIFLLVVAVGLCHESYRKSGAANGG